MAGTVKSCVPELVFTGELVAGGELAGRAGAVAVTEGCAAAGCVWAGDVAAAGDDPAVPVRADVGDAPGVSAEAVAELLAAAAGVTAEGLDPLAAHAVRPAPPMTAAMIKAGTRHLPMLHPPVSNQTLQNVTMAA
jgi:hypothetical protein